MTFYYLAGDKIFKKNNVIDKKYVSDFKLLCSAKKLYMRTILGTVFQKARKKGMYCNSETC